ncbi:MAG TPA: magnesium transporter [Clostridia bacterium]|nr:magnesium transporter [Clostridia bacterium]
MMNRVVELLREKKYTEVKTAVQEMNAIDIAELFEGIDDLETTLRLFRLLPKQGAAEAFSYMESDVQKHIIEAITERELRYILDDMYLDDYVDLVEEMPANVVMRVLKNSSKENRDLINQYLQYPDQSAGSLMTNEYVYLKRTLTVQQAFDVIRTNGVDKETIYTCYVINAERKLEGVVTVRELLLSDPTRRIEDIMSTNVIFSYTLDDQEHIARMFSKYDMLSMPVVDREQRLVGIITIDDAVDVIQSENTEDFEKMAGMAPSEESYMRSSVFTISKNRIGWITVLWATSLITGLLLEHYESAISSLPILVSFIPTLTGTSGNCGTQTSTSVIRGMALDEIRIKDFFKVFWKEIRVALLCGSLLAVLNFLRVWFQYHDLGVALTVSITLIIIITVAKMLGSALPMVAKLLKFDPAVMAAPLLNTLSDCCSVFVFFTLSFWLLGSRL